MGKKKPELSPYLEYQTFLKNKNEIHPIKDSGYYLEKYSIKRGLADIIPCAIYIINYQTQEFLFVSEGCKDILGHNSKEFKSNGVALQEDNYHPEDSKVMSNEIFRKFVAYCKSLPIGEHKNARFSLNFRYLKGGKSYVKIFRQYVVLETDKEGNPLLSLCICTDITSQKSDDKIIFSISHFNEKRVLEEVSTETFFNATDFISKKETEVLKCILKGLTSAEIAEKLKISFFTVKAHRRNILEKTKCKNSPDLLNYALTKGII